MTSSYSVLGMLISNIEEYLSKIIDKKLKRSQLVHKYYQLINYQLDINLAVRYNIFHKNRYSLVKGWSLFGNGAVCFSANLYHRSIKILYVIRLGRGFNQRILVLS